MSPRTESYIQVERATSSSCLSQCDADSKRHGLRTLRSEVVMENWGAESILLLVWLPVSRKLRTLTQEKAITQWVLNSLRRVT